MALDDRVHLSRPPLSPATLIRPALGDLAYWLQRQAARTPGGGPCAKPCTSRPLLSKSVHWANLHSGPTPICNRRSWAGLGRLLCPLDPTGQRPRPGFCAPRGRPAVIGAVPAAPRRPSSALSVRVAGSACPSRRRPGSSALARVPAANRKGTRRPCPGQKALCAAAPAFSRLRGRGGALAPSRRELY